MKKLEVKLFKVEEIKASLLQQMWNLYNSTYDYVNREQFINDFKQKNYVVVAYDKKNKSFQGFSTILLYTTKYLGKSVGVIFSGDTILSPEYWGNKALHMEFLKFAMKWKVKNPLKPLYWNLIASGNRTYLAMARNCYEYYPRYDQPTPKWERGFIDHIGKKQFGDKYDIETGVIVMDEPEAVLKPHLAPFTNQVKSLPEIDFFIQQNQGYEKGDELSCIAKIDLNAASFFLKKTAKKLMKGIEVNELLEKNFSNVFSSKKKLKTVK